MNSWTIIQNVLFCHVIIWHVIQFLDKIYSNFKMSSKNLPQIGLWCAKSTYQMLEWYLIGIDKKHVNL